MSDYLEWCDKWIDECCINMNPVKKHTLEFCKEIASKYKTRGEWQKNDVSTYSTAQKKGWLDECCANMILRPKKHSLESCKESASKYTSRNLQIVLYLVTYKDIIYYR